MPKDPHKIPWFIKLIVNTFQGKIKTIKGLNNLPKNTGYILAANHQSFLDAVFLLIALIPQTKKFIYSISKEELKKSYGSFGEKYLGMIYIDKNNKSKVLETSADYLKKGAILLIFPEGRRNYDSNKLLKGKTGMVRLALKTQVPIVPVGLIMPQGKTTLQAFKNFFFTPQKPKIYIGKPIYLKSYSSLEINKPLLETLTKKIMLAISQLCGKNYPY